MAGGAGAAPARRAATLLALVLGLGAPSDGGAQDRASGSGGAVLLVGGVSGIATGELDERLAASGYPTVGRAAVGVGIGAYMVFPGGVQLGAEWHGLILDEASRDEVAVGLGGGYGTLGLGYVVELTPRLRVYPRLGLGGGGLGVGIENVGPEVEFEQALEQPVAGVDRDDETRLSRSHFVLDAGAGAEFRPLGPGGGPLIGVRIGYLAAPSETAWSLDHARRVLGGPAATVAGPYLRVTIGGAWAW